MKSFLKTFGKILALFYISNIVLYFAYFRSKLLEGIEILFEDPLTRQTFVTSNITKQDLINSTLVDHSIFNPIFNFSYATGLTQLLIPSSIVLLIFVLYTFAKRQKNKTINVS
jgi:hypothetical protein